MKHLAKEMNSAQNSSGMVMVCESWFPPSPNLDKTTLSFDKLNNTWCQYLQFLLLSQGIFSRALFLLFDWCHTFTIHWVNFYDMVWFGIPFESWKFDTGTFDKLTRHEMTNQLGYSVKGLSFKGLSFKYIFLTLYLLNLTHISTKLGQIKRIPIIMIFFITTKFKFQ